MKLFDGIKHSDAPDLEAIMNGKANVSNLVLEGVEMSGKQGENIAVKAKKVDNA